MDGQECEIGENAAPEKIDDGILTRIEAMLKTEEYSALFELTRNVVAKERKYTLDCVGHTAAIDYIITTYADARIKKTSDEMFLIANLKDSQRAAMKVRYRGKDSKKNKDDHERDYSNEGPSMYVKNLDRIIRQADMIGSKDKDSAERAAKLRKSLTGLFVQYILIRCEKDPDVKYGLAKNLDD